MLRAALDAARSGHHPRAQDRAAPRGPRRGGQRASRRAGCGPATGRSACSAWASRSAPAWRPPRAGRRGDRRHGLGRAGGLAARCRMLADAARHRLVVTAEDGVRHGGAGAFLLDAMAAQVESAGSPAATRVLGVPRQFLAQGKADDILASLGLDGAGIAESVRRVRLEVPAEPRTTERSARRRSAGDAGGRIRYAPWVRRRQTADAGGPAGRSAGRLGGRCGPRRAPWRPSRRSRAPEAGTPTSVTSFRPTSTGMQNGAVGGR